MEVIGRVLESDDAEARVRSSLNSSFDRSLKAVFDGYSSSPTSLLCEANGTPDTAQIPVLRPRPCQVSKLGIMRLAVDYFHATRMDPDRHFLNSPNIVRCPELDRVNISQSSGYKSDRILRRS